MPVNSAPPQNLWVDLLRHRSGVRGQGARRSREKPGKTPPGPGEARHAVLCAMNPRTNTPGCWC